MVGRPIGPFFGQLDALDTRYGAIKKRAGYIRIGQAHHHRFDFPALWLGFGRGEGIAGARRSLNRGANLNPCGGKSKGNAQRLDLRISLD